MQTSQEAVELILKPKKTAESAGAPDTACAVGG